jgi:hypothetical protein
MVKLPGFPSKDPELDAGLVLIPGENNVPEWYWNKCLTIRCVKIWHLAEILKNEGVGKAQSLDEGLDNLSKVEANTRIFKCESVKLLRDWADKTESAELKRACNDRINDLIKVEGDDA